LQAGISEFFKHGFVCVLEILQMGRRERVAKDRINWGKKFRENLANHWTKHLLHELPINCIVDS
jgi:flagellar motor switch protein FliM